jgi:hypothetical protein
MTDTPRSLRLAALAGCALLMTLVACGGTPSDAEGTPLDAAASRVVPLRAAVVPAAAASAGERVAAAPSAPAPAGRSAVATGCATLADETVPPPALAWPVVEQADEAGDGVAELVPPPTPLS